MKQQVYNLIIVSLLSLPALLGLAPIMRFGFPTMVLLIAIFLTCKKRYNQYLTFSIWIFFLTPLIRRIVDLQIGWAEPNYLLLAPYFVLFPAVIIAIPRMFLTNKVTWMTGAAVIFCCASYGLLISSIDGRPISAGFDFLKWIAPLCFGVTVFTIARISDSLESDILTTLALAVSITGAYAIYQFVFLPPWDVYWMKNVKMDSIGRPFPFEIRGFSTMNSPGSYGFAIAESLILLASLQFRNSILAITLGLAAVLFTLSRSAWGGLALGCLALLLIGPTAVRSRLTLVAIFITIGGPSLLILPKVQQAIIDRFQTIVDVKSDASFMDRSESYARAISQLGSNVFGSGIGINGTYQSSADGSPSLIIDGGPIEIFSTLGIPVGLVFFAALVTIIIGVVRVKGPPNPILSACKGSVLAAAALLLSSTVTNGELGLFVWLAIGIAYGIGDRSITAKVQKSKPHEVSA